MTLLFFLILSSVLFDKISFPGFWKNVGVGCFDGNRVVNSMQHPMDNDHTIRFLLDPPHAFKTIRNMMLKYKEVQVNNWK